MFDLFGKAFGGIEVALLTLGVSALLVALRVAREFSLGKVPIRLPARPLLRLVWGLAGLGLIGAAFWVAEPRWAPVVVVERAWDGVGERRAVQIASDGDELYVLARGGHVWRVEASGEEVLIDAGTHTAQIEVAGGALYVLKASGNIWSVLLHERVPGLQSPTGAPDEIVNESGQPIAEEGTKTRENRGGVTFTLIDYGIDTRSIVATGETLYILKESGKLMRRNVDPDRKPGLNAYVEIKTERPGQQIAGSGTVLYYLSKEGDIHAVFPLPEARSTSLEDHVNAALGKCGKATQIAADGRKVYFIDEHGSAYVCVDGRPQSIFHAGLEESIRDLDVMGGIVYLLTSKDQIVRYAPGRKVRRFPVIPESEGENNMCCLLATAQGVYAVDRDGSVWRFSESLRKQVRPRGRR